MKSLRSQIASEEPHVLLGFHKSYNATAMAKDQSELPLEIESESPKLSIEEWERLIRAEEFSECPICGSEFYMIMGCRKICNCGYMVPAQARGKGVASAMCEHSQEIARELGYKAMQFNFVVSSNTGAVRLWNKLGFETVGRLPRAFLHPAQGYVDALVMYKWLEP